MSDKIHREPKLENGRATVCPHCNKLNIGRRKCYYCGKDLRR